MALTQTLCILSFKEGEGLGLRRSLSVREGRWLGLGPGLQGWGGRKGLLDGGWPSRLRMPGLRMEQGLRMK